MSLNFDDFQKQDIKFDINKLQEAYKELLNIKGFTGGCSLLELETSSAVVVESSFAPGEMTLTESKPTD